MSKTKEIKIHDGKDGNVAELYALRAGLSVISQKVDEVRNYEDEIDEENERVDDIQSYMDAKSREISNLRTKISNIKENINASHSNYSQNVGKLAEKKHYKNVENKYSISHGALWTFIIGVVVLLISIWLNSMVDGDGMFIFYIISGLLMVIPIIICIVRELRHKRFVKSAKLEVDNNIVVEERQIKELEAQLSVLSKEKSSIMEQKQEVQEEVDNKIKELNEKISDLANETSVYNSILEKTYSKLLNPADWKNVDLCIFYLQTGRADTIKECLQLVDRQRQNDEIVHAINAASNSICTEIRGGFAALGSTMVTCLNALSNQMEVMSNTLSSQHAETVRALGAIENNSVEVLSAIQLNNALQEKANTSSEGLLKDYKYVQSKYGIHVYE